MYKKLARDSDRMIILLARVQYKARHALNYQKSVVKIYGWLRLDSHLFTERSQSAGDAYHEHEVTLQKNFREPKRTGLDT